MDGIATAPPRYSFWEDDRQSSSWFEPWECERYHLTPHCGLGEDTCYSLARNAPQEIVVDDAFSILAMPRHDPAAYDKGAVMRQCLATMSRIVETARQNLDKYRKIVEEFENETWSISKWGGRDVVNSVWVKKVARGLRHGRIDWNFATIERKFVGYQAELQAQITTRNRDVDSRSIIIRQMSLHCEKVIQVASPSSHDFMSFRHLVSQLDELVRKYDLEDEKVHDDFLAYARRTGLDVYGTVGGV
ncbi:hypothetical protein MKZ38_004183 [Zalerion maritima]|uniref:Uncharacterized protein n=1 Tax=Zalerion maritima TaxID=339359 RepID=A0AAD5RLT7_9PEZI|nr:hypothetical protein MKZ38_004183 [Zalerion maritima]